MWLSRLYSTFSVLRYRCDFFKFSIVCCRIAVLVLLVAATVIGPVLQTAPKSQIIFQTTTHHICHSLSIFNNSVYDVVLIFVRKNWCSRSYRSGI
ncbi:hypothetical protein PAXRUDRAFT_485895 [Paxillus rubicundulus Ve08.2h10]|uniref:Uncharacterized protein n=1 Tax=Paxillus rubicundulus Ve08.2h10 TaxID=930991 RepID=A0A0D0D9Z6_9AGAM|nr:hypothetical protein PAXRUDRAFT_485895 [Paxillus rubicundulus Ve08.2h10]